VLREIAGVRQDHPDLRRRWFQDDYLDLFVWTSPAAELIAFQLAYDRAGDEHLLDWAHSRGYLHRRVDDGRGSFKGIGATPLLALGKRFPKSYVIAQFDARSATLDASLRRMVRQRLAAYRPGRTRRHPTPRRGNHRAHRF
jgi:hypothetical protein